METDDSFQYSKDTGTGPVINLLIPLRNFIYYSFKMQFNIILPYIFHEFRSHF
jgi:hypothetical protein